MGKKHYRTKMTAAEWLAFQDEKEREKKK